MSTKSKSNKALAQFKKSVQAHNVKFEKVQSGSVWKPEKSGESVCGIIAARNVIDTKFGLSPQVEIRDGETAYLLLTSKAGLKVLNRIPLETAVRVTYKGTKKIEGRKTLMDVFDVEKDKAVDLEKDDWAAQYYKKEKGGKRGASKRNR